MAVLRRRGKWIVDVYTADGRRLRRVSPVQTKRGALAFEKELLANGGSSTSRPCSSSDDSTEAPSPTTSPAPAEPTSSAPGFSDFAVEWLGTYAVNNNKPSEVVNKESALRVHLIPFFENRPIDTITARDIEAYKAAKLAGEGCPRGPIKAKTVNNHLVILGKLLRTAEEWGVLETVPKIRRLKAEEAPFDWLRPEESKKYLAAAEAHYPQWSAMLWLALRTGMRRGELFALRWENADFGNRLITVRHSAFRGKLGPTKNSKVRQIPISSRLMQVLQAHERDKGRHSPFVFPNRDGKLSRHMDHVNRPHHGSLEAAGLRRIKFHELRHTFASQLVTAGRSLAEVQELLGHKSVEQTMRYAHLSPDRMHSAVEALEAFDDED